MDLRIDQSDLKKINKKLKGLEDFPDREVGRSLDKFAKQAAYRMKKEAPVDTGNLQQQIEGSASKHDALIESRALTTNGKDYAVYQEYGTRFQDGSPYFWRNVNIGVKQLIQELQQKLKRLTA